MKPLRAWWWKNIPSVKKRNRSLRVSFESPLHGRETLRAAWYYEAEKRLTGRYRFGGSFATLAMAEIRKAVYLWGYDAQDKNSSFVMCEPSDQTAKPFETRTMYWPRLSLNLDCSNKAIFRVLAFHLNRVRADRGIKLPQKGSQPGVNPHADEPWSMIEAWDKSAKGESLDDSGRKLKSEMEKRYRARTRWSDLPEVLARI